MQIFQKTIFRLCVVIGVFAFPFIVFAAHLSFNDSLRRYVTTRWYAADGFDSGDDFNCSWAGDHVNFADGIMTLLLDDVSSSTKPYSCAQYQTLYTYQYGRFSTHMKAVAAEGVVTAFFVFDEDSSLETHDEIDIEILGEDTTKMQVNYFKDGVEHPATVSLGFDASQDFHTYSFVWTPTFIKWYVDRTLVYSVSTDIPSKAGKIMANLWTGTASLEDWMGFFTYDVPLEAQFDRINYYTVKTGF